MFRSSIFSSDSLNLSGLRPYGLAFCLVILALVELGIARRVSIWEVFPRSDTGVFHLLEDEVITVTDSPDVVILGNSRIRDAAVPRLLEEELALERGSVLNLGITAGEPFDALTMYRRNRSRLGQARVMILGIEDWEMVLRPGATDRVREFATLEQRLDWYRGTTRLGLAVGWFWRTYDARFVLRTMLRTRRIRRTGGLPIGEDGRISWRRDDAELGPDETEVEERVESYYGDYGIWQERAQHFFGTMIEMAREDGIDVFLLRPPLRDRFVDLREERRPDVSASFRRFLQWAHETHGVAVLDYDRGSSLGFDETQFLDYGHLSGRGARAFTRVLARDLRESRGLATGSRSR